MAASKINRTRASWFLCRKVDPLIPARAHHLSSRAYASRPIFFLVNSGRSCVGRIRAFSAHPTGVVRELMAELERDRKREREARLRAGLDTADIDAEDDEDYLGVGPLIEKLEKENKQFDQKLNSYEEPTDSDSDEDEWLTPDDLRKRKELFEKKFEHHKDLLRNFAESETLDDAFKWMTKIDKFEDMHFPLRPEYRVIGELMNFLKSSTGKEKFILQQKLNRAMRLVEWKEKFDPNDLSNYGVIQNNESGAPPELLEHSEQAAVRVDLEKDEDEEFDEMRGEDDLLMEKLTAIDKKLDEKLAVLDHTFGRKGKALEEEIRDLAEERNEITESKRRPMYRKGFDVKMINVNRTCKVTKGGQLVKYTAMVVCGNYHGLIGFAKGRGPTIPVALQKAHERCFQDLHYVERYEEHTIAHAVQSTFKKTKVYLWPASTRTGMRAGRIVETILSLAGYRNVKSKVVGSRNPHNTVKALFQALNAVETPKDIQEKFGRTVIESYLT